MAQQTSYNGNRFSFTDITIDGETTQLFGSVRFQFPKGVLQSLNWKASQDKGIVQGNQVGIVGRTTGYGTCTGDMSMLVSEADDWENTITSGGTFPILAVYFNLRIVYSVNGTDVRVDSLQGVTLNELGSDNAKGNDPTITTYSLNIAKAWKNGRLVFGDPTV